MSNKQEDARQKDDRVIRTWDDFQERFFPEQLRLKRLENETAAEAGARIANELLESFKSMIDRIITGGDEVSKSWNVMFLLGLETTETQRQEIMRQIPRSHATVAANNGTMIGVRQGAPTSLDATNRVGGQLRKILDRSKLEVIEVKVRPVSDEQAHDDKIDDLVRRFREDGSI